MTFIIGRGFAELQILKKKEKKKREMKMALSLEPSRLLWLHIDIDKM